MLNYNEIKPKKFIIHENEPWEVIEAQVSRKQANKPVNKTKLKNLISGTTIDYTFHVSDKVKEADIEKREVKYLYQKRDEFWFCSPDNPGDRFMLDESIAKDATKYITPNSIVSIKIFNEDTIFGIEIPIKVTLEVKEAPPSIKGNTASGGDKLVTLETGLKVTTPLFIEAGTKIVVNTDTGTYIERAK